jgi:hypothetical protein
VRAAEINFEVQRVRMMAPHIHTVIRPVSDLQRLIDGSEYPSPPYEHDATGHPVTNLLIDRQQPLHATGVTWLGQPAFTPTNSNYTQLRPRPDNNDAPTAGPLQSPPLDLHASPHVDTIALASSSAMTAFAWLHLCLKRKLRHQPHERYGWIHPARASACVDR